MADPKPYVKGGGLRQQPPLTLARLYRCVFSTVLFLFLHCLLCTEFRKADNVILASVSSAHSSEQAK